ncbi:MAG: hypothetical protein EBX36_03835 [Planctomycetia bacterium]|nr:hypothetical protein [Planctomycetia bacterium]
MTRRSRRRPASTSSPSRQVFSLAAAERLEVRTAFTCNMPTQENTLDPLLIHKYENPLPNPLDSASVYRPSSVSTAYGVRNESYTVGMYRTTQDILGNVDVMGPDGTSVIGTTHFRTPIYGYGTSQATASFPGKTFVVPQNTNVSVHWVNQLGTVANYLMNPYMDGSDMMNTPDMMAMPANDGVPTVPHLHGGHTESGSDGQPDQWFTQALPETPGGRPVIDRGPQAVKANDTYVYDASVNATAHEYWYHDHALGYTRTNVYAGLAGLYFTRDSLDTGTAANKLGLPSGKYEVPLMIADKMFTPDGQLYYPHQVDPSGCVRMLPEAFGDVMTVNGKAWPVMHVEPRAYRFRMLDGCDSRFLNLWLARDTDTTLAPAATLMQVGTDQGLLARPVAQQKLLLGPGERADIVVDFSKFAPGTKLVMRNDAPTPYDGGDPVDPATTGQVMEFIVDAPLTRSYPNPTLKAALLPAAIKQLTPTRGQAAIQVGLFESEVEETFTVPDTAPGAVAGATTTATFTAIVPKLGTLQAGPLDYHDPNTETIPLNNTAVWEIYNTTADVHPVHLHLVAFQVLSRQDFTVNEVTGAYEKTGDVRPATGGEAGWKDTVPTYPGTVTRIVAKFDRPGTYMWHCHIFSHEENDMMRPFKVAPVVRPRVAAVASAAPFAFSLPAIAAPMSGMVAPGSVATQGMASIPPSPMSAAGDEGSSPTGPVRAIPTPYATAIQRGVHASRSGVLAGKSTAKSSVFRSLAHGN